MTAVATVGGSGYTHGLWHEDMFARLEIISGIQADLEQMEASLVGVVAGQTQLRLIREARAEAARLMESGGRILIETDDRYEGMLRVLAGRVHEFAQVKSHHTLAGA